MHIKWGAENVMLLRFVVRETILSNRLGGKTIVSLFFIVSQYNGKIAFNLSWSSWEYEMEESWKWVEREKYERERHFLISHAIPYM